jgi:large subunit ribosomal protein L24
MKKKKEQAIKKSRLKQGDTVRILLGKDRGKKGKVMAVLPADGKILVEGINMVKKHIRPRKSGEKGQRVSVAAPMQISNVQLICSACKKGTRIGVKRENGERQRICKKCNAEI